VGTSSVRRKALLARSRPDLQCVLLRGNIETRLARLDSGQMEAAILAFAGLRRLGLASRATSLFEPGDWLNAPAQGAIGIEVRADDSAVRQTICRLDDKATAIAIACERAFLAALDGSCRTPIGALAQWNGCRLTFRGEVLAPDGSDNATARFDDEPSGDIRARAAQLGRQAGLSLRPRAAGWLGF
jgi:hydroxymethylbilane synthase